LRKCLECCVKFGPLSAAVAACSHIARRGRRTKNGVVKVTPQCVKRQQSRITLRALFERQRVS
jgi:hypothetical protein